MAWISVYEGIKDHPKIRNLFRLLGCSRQEAIGVLVLLWQWGLINADRSGKIMNACDEDIAEGILYTKIPAKQLVSVLVKSGWIDVDIDGTYVLHDWDEWQNQWYQALDRREKEARRKREQRNDASCGQSCGQSGGQSADNSTEIPRKIRTLSASNRNRNLTVTVTNTGTVTGESTDMPGTQEGTAHTPPTEEEVGIILTGNRREVHGGKVYIIQPSKGLERH